MVVDQHHRDRAAQGPDRVRQRRQLLAVQAAGGLVEEQQVGLAGQRPGERDSLLHGIGQLPGLRLGHVDAADPLQRRQRALAQRALVAVGPRARQHRADDAGAAEALGSHHHVLADGQAGEEADALQRPGDPQRGQPVGADPVKRLPAPAHRARRRLDEAADDVEQRRLAGAVGADDAEHLALRDLERDAVQRGDAAKRHRDLAHRELAAGLLLRRHGGQAIAARRRCQ